MTVQTVNLEQDYQSACSEVILLRKGLVEILDSVRQHDGNVKLVQQFMIYLHLPLPQVGAM